MQRCIRKLLPIFVPLSFYIFIQIKSKISPTINIVWWLDCVCCSVYVVAEIVWSAFYICFTPSIQYNVVGKMHAPEKEYTLKYKCSQKAI